MKAVKSALIAMVAVGLCAGCFGGEQRKADPELDKVVVQGNNEFALALFARLRENQGNLFFSPYSISTALAMTYAGARGQTETQMAKVLHFPTLAGEKVPPEPVMQEGQFHSAFGVVVKDLNQRAKKGNYELAVANALWGQKGYKLLNDFLRLIETEYGGRLTEVDFVTATESARKTINTWVEEKTKDKIKELLKPGVLDAMTRLVLTNAIYFKGNWARQFKKDRNKQSPFTLASGEKVDAPMMNQTGEFRYREAEDFQALELPYVDNELSMIILLPRDTDGLPKFEKTLNLKDFSQWLDRLHRREVIVSVPRFKMTSQFSLASVLTSMGMADAFSARAADFSGITGGRDLFISAVIHKAYVDVNEEGTEAAAATGVTMRLTSAGPTQTPVFRADHPFLFLIRDNHSGSILFIGRLMNPQV